MSGPEPRSSFRLWLANRGEACDRRTAVLGIWGVGFKFQVFVVRGSWDQSKCSRTMAVVSGLRVWKVLLSGFWHLGGRRPGRSRARFSVQCQTPTSEGLRAEDFFGSSSFFELLKPVAGFANAAAFQRRRRRMSCTRLGEVLKEAKDG